MSERHEPGDHTLDPSSIGAVYLWLAFGVVVLIGGGAWLAYSVIS